MAAASWLIDKATCARMQSDQAPCRSTSATGVVPGQPAHDRHLVPQLGLNGPSRVRKCEHGCHQTWEAVRIASIVVRGSMSPSRRGWPPARSSTAVPWRGRFARSSPTLRPVRTSGWHSCRLRNRLAVSTTCRFPNVQTPRERWISRDRPRRQRRLRGTWSSTTAGSRPARRLSLTARSWRSELPLYTAWRAPPMRFSS